MFLVIIKGDMELLGGRNNIVSIVDKMVNRDDIIDILCNNRADMFPYAIDIESASYICNEISNNKFYDTPQFGSKLDYINLEPTKDEIAKFRKSKHK